MEPTESKRGGILLRDGEALWFVPASVAVKVAPLPEVTRVPGAPAELLGIAQIDGEILPVIALGNDRPKAGGALLVCSYLGEEIGLVGGQIVGTGSFEVDEDGVSVSYAGESARPLDLAAIYARLQSGPWAGRWRG